MSKIQIITLTVLMIFFVILRSNNYVETNFEHSQTLLHGNNAGVIAFRSDRGGNPEIYVMNADGSAQTRLTNHPLHDMNPSIAPDGNKVASLTGSHDPNAATNFPRCNFEIHTMNIHGGSQQRINSNHSMEGMPRWSPDGSQIASMSDHAGYQAIWVMSADGTNVRQFTNQTDQFGECLEWSPDGKQIAYHAPKDNNYEICTMDSDGSNHKRLTNHDGNDMWPAGELGSMPTDVNGNRDFQGLLPEKFQLFQNYPNPFNTNTTIRYHLSQPGKMRLQIFDTMDRLIHPLIDSQQEAGDYQISWNGTDRDGLKVSTGIYLC